MKFNLTKKGLLAVLTSGLVLMTGCSSKNDDSSKNDAEISSTIVTTETEESNDYINDKKFLSTKIFIGYRYDRTLNCIEDVSKFTGVDIKLIENDSYSGCGYYTTVEQLINSPYFNQIEFNYIIGENCNYLWDISERTGVSIENICKYNNKTDPNRVYNNESIKLPVSIETIYYMVDNDNNYFNITLNEKARENIQTISNPYHMRAELYKSISENINILNDIYNQNRQVSDVIRENNNTLTSEQIYEIDYSTTNLYSLYTQYINAYDANNGNLCEKLIHDIKNASIGLYNVIFDILICNKLDENDKESIFNADYYNFSENQVKLSNGVNINLVNSIDDYNVINYINFLYGMKVSDCTTECCYLNQYDVLIENAISALFVDFNVEKTADKTYNATAKPMQKSITDSIVMPEKTKELTSNVQNNNDKIIDKNNYYVGVDISNYQSDIDWNQLANNVDFVILRVGFSYYDLIDKTKGDSVNNYKCTSSAIDSKFKEYARNCNERGIPIGVYFYSNAQTKEQLTEEINITLDAIKEFEITLPIYRDVECISGYELNSNNPDIKQKQINYTKIFCDTMHEYGYESGIYTSVRYYQEGLLDDLSEYSHWLCGGKTYDNNCTINSIYYGSYNGVKYELDDIVNIYQSSSRGSIKEIGIGYSASSYVDINYADPEFIDTLIKNKEKLNVKN